MWDLTMCRTSGSGSGGLVPTNDSSSDNVIVDFRTHVHDFRLYSLRGSNRHQRVEHSRCACGEERTRVWLGDMNQPRPDREYKRAS